MLDVRIRRLDPRRKSHAETNLASLIHFRPGVSEAEIVRALKTIERVLAGPVDINEFDPDYGTPTFYIP